MLEGKTEDHIQVINLSSDVKRKIKFVTSKAVSTVARRSPRLHRPTEEIIDDVRSSASLPNAREVDGKYDTPERRTSVRLRKSENLLDCDADSISDDATETNNDQLAVHKVERTRKKKTMKKRNTDSERISKIPLIYIDMSTNSLTKKRKRKHDTPPRRTSARLSKSGIYQIWIEIYFLQRIVQTGKKLKEDRKKLKRSPDLQLKHQKH